MKSTSSCPPSGRQWPHPHEPSRRGRRAVWLLLARDRADRPEHAWSVRGGRAGGRSMKQDLGFSPAELDYLTDIPVLCSRSPRRWPPWPAGNWGGVRDHPHPPRRARRGNRAVRGRRRPGHPRHRHPGGRHHGGQHRRPADHPARLRPGPPGNGDGYLHGSDDLGSFVTAMVTAPLAEFRAGGPALGRRRCFRRRGAAGSGRSAVGRAFRPRPCRWRTRDACCGQTGVAVDHGRPYRRGSPARHSPTTG